MRRPSGRSSAASTSATVAQHARGGARLRASTARARRRHASAGRPSRAPAADAAVEEAGVGMPEETRGTRRGARRASRSAPRTRPRHDPGDAAQLEEVLHHPLVGLQRRRPGVDETHPEGSRCNAPGHVSHREGGRGARVEDRDRVGGDRAASSSGVAIRALPRPGLAGGAAQLCAKFSSVFARDGLRSLRSAFASICRMRSRVTANRWPTSSSV